MRRWPAIFLTSAVICCLLSGCGFWMEGDYLFVTPHEVQMEMPGDAIIEVSSYGQMRKALNDVVESCTEKCIISIANFNEATIDFYVKSAVNHIRNNTSVGAYGVEEITYEVGTNRGDVVVAFDIQYTHSRQEILGMLQVKDAEEMAAAVTEAMKQNEAYVVMRTDDYKSFDFLQLAQDYANNNPDLIMEMPHVGVSLYPNRGSDRIVAITFTYLNDRETLYQMQEQVASVFKSAELYVKETSQVVDIYSRLYSFLMQRDEYSMETSITPAYSLLQHGVGDSRAFASVYAAMCRKAGLNCTIVNGTRDGEPWCWNLVRFRGEYYHVDLLRCNELDEFKMQNPKDMTGYVWNYSAYPQE